MCIFYHTHHHTRTVWTCSLSYSCFLSSYINSFIRVIYKHMTVFSVFGFRETLQVDAFSAFRSVYRKNLIHPFFSFFLLFSVCVILWPSLGSQRANSSGLFLTLVFFLDLSHEFSERNSFHVSQSLFLSPTFLVFRDNSYTSGLHRSKTHSSSELCPEFFSLCACFV